MNYTTISRRRFLGVAAGAAAAVSAGGGWAARAFAGATDSGERLVPPGKLGLQQWSVRDAITRLNGSVSGYLGGPNFPEDPTDLGPLVPLPGGFRAVFEYLASVGYRGFEFFQFTQGANGPITTAEIRQALDDAGLLGVGTHTGSVGTLSNPANLQTQIDMANTLGYTLIGTAGDPSNRATLGDNPANPNQIGWQTAADRANAFGDVLAAAGITWYWHPEQNAFQFFNDPDHPELSRTHRIDWWTANTNPATIRFEPDILHAYAGRARFPDPVDGSLWDAFGFWKANAHRLIGWHVKDGSRIVPPPPAGTNPFTQTIARTATFTDAIIVGEGSIGQGYPVDPDPAVVGFRRLFDEVGVKGAKWYLVESDSGPGPATDPGRSLRHAKLSAEYLLGLRAGSKGSGQSDASEPATFESDGEAGG
jgi:sugar phosphate isomerase/epimerase